MKNSFYKDKNILYIVLSFAFLVFAGLSKDPKVLNYPPFTEFINTNTLIVIIPLIYLFLGIIIHSQSLGINGNYLELFSFYKKQEQIDLMKIKSVYLIEKTEN